MRKLILLTALFLTFGKLNGADNIGIFTDHLDIGNPRLPGNTVYNTEDQSYHLTGAGYNIWFERDEFQYAFKSVKGDFILTANFEFIGNGKNPHRKIGWMIRESLEDNASHISAAVHGDGLTEMQWRQLRGSNMIEKQDEAIAPK